ncbi:MAG: diguanylate cyclase, partial [Chloroflexota bacterium]
MQEKEKEHSRLAAINEIIKTIGFSLDLRGVYEAFAAQLSKLVSFDRTSIALIEGDRLEFFALSSSLESELGEGTVVPLAGTATSWIAAHKEAYIAADLTKERRFWSEDVHFREGLRSVIRIPLFFRGVVIGSFNLSSRQPNAYGAEEREILEQIAGPLAVAIENFRLFEQVRAVAEELLASEEKYRALVDEINDAYWVVQGDRIVFANRRSAELHGYPLEELLGRSYFELVAPEAMDGAREILEKSLRGEAVPERYEVMAVRADGTMVPTEVGLRAITYEGRAAYSVIIRDITERKRAEEALAEHARREETLHAVAAMVSQSLELEQMLDSALGKVMEVTRTDAAYITFFEAETRTGYVKAHRGLSQEFVSKIPTVVSPEDVGRWLEHREPAFGLRRMYGGPALDQVLAAAEKEGLQSFVAVPLWAKAVIYGALVLVDRSPRRFSSEELELLQAIASEVAVGIENARLFAELRNAAITDMLTGLYNHRHFQERLEGEVARVFRFGGECSLIMLDLDFFKVYNDLYGHVAGDQALKRLGQALRDYTRQVDIAFRYGGEEFAVILPQTGRLYAYQAAERLRQGIEMALSLEGMNLTVSLGAASCPSEALSPEELIRCADLALRDAKERGGNQARLASDLPSAVLEKSGSGWETARHLKTAGPNKIYALASGVDARDHYTYGHSRNVSRYAVVIGQALGLSDAEIEQLRIVALLHDIGKIGISDGIIRKPA